MSRAKTEADYRDLAKSRGFTWLGPPVPNSHARTGWQCAAGHHWQTAYRAIRQGAGCPVCAGNARKTAADYHALAAGRGFRWLGPVVRNTMSQTAWQCPAGHVWYSSYNTLDKGSNCIVCVRRTRRLAPAYHRLAEQAGLVWLGPDVAGRHHLTNWRCPHGHDWAATYQEIYAGRRCPICQMDKSSEPV
jgi:hypothetical protein